MVQKRYIKSAFDLFIQNKTKKSSGEKNSCIEKYKKSLPDGFCLVYPVSVSLKVTADCNLRCKHCFYSGEPEIYNPENDSSKEDIFELIDFLIDDLNVLYLTLTGGEPFLRPDFLDIIEYAKKKGVILSVQTNGVLLTEKDAERLSKVLYPKTDVIHISLEGATREVHDSIRGKGTFDKTINAIKLLRKHNLTVQVNSTLTSASAPDLDKLFELCDSLGVTKMSISKFQVCHENHRYLEPSLADIMACCHRIKQKIPKFSHIFTTPLIVNIYDFLKLKEGRELLDEYLEKNPPKGFGNKCLSCHNHNKIVISAKGDVFLCSAYEEPETTLGNLHEKDFLEIWESRHNNPYFQKRDITTLKCKHCKYITMCAGGCLASAYKKYGDINMAPAECTYFEEYLRGLNE